MTPAVGVAARLIRASQRASRELRALHFAPPVHCVYDPLQYAWLAHKLYLQRFAQWPRPYLLLGMNPGPYGMAQTGVPFGDVAMVRDWLGIETQINRPAQQHLRRPVDGFACTRSEVSGSRLWGWARERFGIAEQFFAHFYVHNYCPLAFMAESGRNITPDKLPASERKRLFAICDQLLLAVIGAMQPKLAIGIGAFAEQRARCVAGPLGVAIGRIPHPSPASPAANRGWAQAADAALEALGVCP